ncbi:MAG TPA: ABC transporter ATP-binding protein, partial [Alphaproteobacteria bacterium]|nr:ABC transporter ATP-binding protein [Alphaproteobacteria bacterium]
MTNKQPKIEIAHLAKSFDNKTVLRDVSLSIPAGQSLCIIGTSGCGKSVTLKCLLGLITPDEGSIKIDGVETVGQS